MPFSLEEYFTSTYEKLLVKMPEREDDHLTQATKLLEKRREMTEVEQTLMVQKEEFQMKMESLQQRREEMERKEGTLKESLQKFDHFLKENDSKRSRAIKKAQDEREAKLMKEHEIERLEEEISALVHDREKMIEKLHQYQKYQNFLEVVLEKSDEFSEIHEITGRYDTLISTYNDLFEKSAHNQEEVERQRQILSKLMEEKQNEIMNCNNSLSHFQGELERAQSETVKLESEWNAIQTTAAAKTLELGRIKMAALNLFNLVNTQLKLSDIDDTDTGLQLEKIMQFIQDLTQITNEIKAQEVQAISTNATSVSY